MNEPPPCITVSNINEFKPAFTVDPELLPESAVWKIFDEDVFRQSLASDLIPLPAIISRKDQSKDPRFIAGEKPDPRETAYRFMVENVRSNGSPRSPILVVANQAGNFEVVDGNATIQIIMLAGWARVPCLITESE